MDGATRERRPINMAQAEALQTLALQVKGLTEFLCAIVQRYGGDVSLSEEQMARTVGHQLLFEQKQGGVRLLVKKGDNADKES